MNTSDGPARLSVGNLHQVPKNGSLGLDLVGFLQGKPDRDRITYGTVANIHLMQERLSPAGGGEARQAALSPGGGRPRS